MTVTAAQRTSFRRTVMICAGLALMTGLGIMPVETLEAQRLRASAEMSPDTRAQLQARLERLQEIVARGGDSESVPDAKREIRTIKTRLSQGDFEPGDVVQLYVRADSTLTGSFRVNTERMLALPTIENLDVRGVLYSEADSVIREHLGQFLKDTRVEVKLTRRIAILGGVQQPGFYDLPPSTTLSDALMAAGGPTARAKVQEVKLRRSGSNLLEGRNVNLRQLTLADLGPSVDDELYVPQRSGGFGAIEALGILSGLSGTIFALSRAF